MTGRCLSALLGGLALLTSFHVSAADLVVLTSTGANFKAGQTLPADAKLGLAVGQALTLMMPSGKVVKVTGPADAVPSESGAVDDKAVLAALTHMVKSRQADTSSLGTFRSSESELPDPWLVDVSRAGERCVLAGEPLVFWRPDGASPAAVTLVQPSNSWKARADWPAGSQRLLGPESIALMDGDTLSVDINALRTDLSIRVIPAEARSESKRLTLLVRNNCMAQAQAMVRQLE